MTTFGVTSQGFVPKTLQNLLSDLEAGELATVDAALDTSPAQPMGQLNAIFADKLADLWALGATAYNSTNRDSGEGPQLDNINGLTGTKRKSAFPSFTLQTNVFSQVGTFAIGSLVANVTGQANIQFSNGDQLVIALNAGTYSAVVNNVTLATSASLPITVPGMKFLCTQNGPIVASAGTLAQITAPVTGWTSTTNPLDATLGAFTELDTPYRLRGAQEIAAVGSGNPDAMRADLLNVPGVINAFVIENTLPVIDAYGNPPHSFLVVIWDGVVPAANDSAIAQAIWNDKSTGIGPQGTITDGVALDNNNTQHTMPFNRAQQLTLYVNFTVTMLPGVTFNATVAQAIKQAVVAASQAPTMYVQSTGTQAPNPAYLGLGVTVVVEALESAVLSCGQGVADVTATVLDFHSTPVDTTNQFVSPLQIAIADTSRILVNGI